MFFQIYEFSIHFEKHCTEIEVVWCVILPFNGNEIHSIEQHKLNSHWTYSEHKMLLPLLRNSSRVVEGPKHAVFGSCETLSPDKPEFGNCYTEEQLPLEIILSLLIILQSLLVCHIVLWTFHWEAWAGQTSAIILW